MAATLKHRLAKARESGVLGAGATAAEVEEERRSVVPNVRLPVRWGQLPATAKWEDEVEWVHQNRVLVVGRTAAGLVRLDWNLAMSPAPSMGAVGLMQDAAMNPQWFSRDILPKAKGRGSEEEVKELREERLRAEEIERVLASLEEADQKFAADVPGVVRERVRGMLSDWTRQHGVVFPDDARASLEAHVGDLVQKCMEAVGRTSGAA